MKEAAKNSKNRYQMEYQLEVPVSAGLKPLFQQIEEIRSELGIEPSDDHFSVMFPCRNKYIRYRTKALIYYSREDALSVLTGGMSEEDYIMRHISSSTDKDGNILTDEDGGLDDFSVTDIF